MNGCTNNNKNVISACMNERTLLAKRKPVYYIYYAYYFKIGDT